LPWPSGKPFRILSIDGGGIRGILPAALLAEFETRHLGGRSAGDYFDLITGTSTGGIIALGLSVGMRASEILQLYIDCGEAIFPPIRPPFRKLKSGLRFLRSLPRYRYERDSLERELRRLFGDRQLGEARCRLCIPAFDGFTEVHIFKTPHHPDLRLDWREQMVTAALATSAAPTFFSVYRNGDRRFADGGVWANNPVMVGLTDALSCHALDRRQVEILSLGCGESDMLITEPQVRLGGLWHWKEIISSAMRLAGQNALGQAGLLVGRDHLLRMDAPLMPDHPIELDDYHRAREVLPPLARALADEFAEIVGQRFFTTPAEPYEAHHGPRA
jgi:patatin-like phospholipase/acyl hydrolase